MAATSADDVVLRESERFEAVRSTIEELQVVAMNVDDVIVRGSLHSLLSHLEGQCRDGEFVRLDSRKRAASIRRRKSPKGASAGLHVASVIT